MLQKKQPATYNYLSILLDTNTQNKYIDGEDRAPIAYSTVTILRERNSGGCSLSLLELLEEHRSFVTNNVVTLGRDSFYTPNKTTASS